MLPGDYSGHQDTQAASDNGSKSGVKRRTRNRYISVACNECKRRKIKCNGRDKCERCSKLGLDCVYASNSNIRDSEEFQQMKAHVTNLQAQVESLYANISGYQQSRDNATDSYSDSSHATHSRGAQSQASPPPNRKYPIYHGPTSSAYSFNVAKSSLQSMGIAPNPESNDPSLSGEASPLPKPSHTVTSSYPGKDPLWIISRDEAHRLVRQFDEEICVMYPIFDVNSLNARIDLLWRFIEAALRAGFGDPTLPGTDALDDDETNILKMVLASSLLLENNGQSHMAQRLFDSVRPSLETKLWNPPDMKTLILVVLVATYFFDKADEVMAWRVIGFAARMGQQLGLHRRDTLIKNFPNEAEYRIARDTFWAIYALDRRWSIGTGLPFVLHDEDIDPLLPEPDDSNPHLKALVKFGRLASKFWYFPSAFEGISDRKRDEMKQLDYDCLQWYKDLPASLTFDHDLVKSNLSGPINTHRTGLVLYLRLNLARLQIYRPVLYSAISIYENRSEVRTAIDVAKDTIRILTRVNQISDLYRTHQITYNFFLVQALAALLLAVCHAPADYGKDVREEFYLAIDLVRGFSTNSFVAERLWRTIHGLREIGEKLGLDQHHQHHQRRKSVPSSAAAADDAEEEDAHSSAAMAMAGLAAGHPIENIVAYNNSMASGGGNPPIEAEASGPLTGMQMSNELTNLFEFAYGNWTDGPGAGGAGGHNMQQGFVGDGGGGGGGAAMTPGFQAAYGNEQEFSRIMGEIY